MKCTPAYLAKANTKRNLLGGGAISSNEVASHIVRNNFFIATICRTVFTSRHRVSILL